MHHAALYNAWCLSYFPRHQLLQLQGCGCIVHGPVQPIDRGSSSITPSDHRLQRNLIDNAPPQKFHLPHDKARGAVVRETAGHRPVSRQRVREGAPILQGTIDKNTFQHIVGDGMLRERHSCPAQMLGKSGPLCGRPMLEDALQDEVAKAVAAE